MNYDVVYGDTDSIMINTNSTDYDQVIAIGAKVSWIRNLIEYLRLLVWSTLWHNIRLLSRKDLYMCTYFRFEMKSIVNIRAWKSASTVCLNVCCC
jgi:hypothetical protein